MYLHMTYEELHQVVKDNQGLIYETVGTQSRRVWYISFNDYHTVCLGQNGGWISSEWKKYQHFFCHEDAVNALAAFNDFRQSK